MPTIEQRPLTPGQRFHVKSFEEGISNSGPEKRLSEFKKRTGGRNCYGRITSRRRGGGHKKRIRKIDFKREKFDIPARVKRLEYDPNRSASIALLVYADGEKRYILAPTGVAIGDTLVSFSGIGEFREGNNMPLRSIPPSTKVHSISTQPGKAAQFVRSAGVSAQLVAIDGDRATLRMPSGEVRMVHSNCRATIGEVGNASHRTSKLGKAGRSRWKGRRPRVRGVAMNPVDHPMGGGEGRSSGGGHPVSPWGQLSKGFPTRSRSQQSNRMILVRRKGNKLKR
ncbi:MAG: 50S ribosomal protein L2 [Candidatus Moanabacter tarae]|uniref:Large ribosomal subunit protein uL2 n=1 Tax=Candidatus Moanibacter tarae TaxID=2200854 RepID=A0A2Z4ABJ4_9BACT|nr:MAG: 50S ribosomal protein L2 [Candidatus Moanabacter tarae]